jgi:hypothetical protein
MDGKALASIYGLLKQGALKSDVVRAVLRRDPSRELANRALPNNNDVSQWFAKRNSLNNQRDPVPPGTSWTPRDERRKFLLSQGYTMGEIDRMLA